MRVLVVSPLVPWPLNAGNRVRIFNMVSEIAERHDVTLVAQSTRFDDESGIQECRGILGGSGVQIQVVRQPNRMPSHRLAYKVGFHRTRAKVPGLLSAEYYNDLPLWNNAVSSAIAVRRPDVVLLNYWYTAQRAVSLCGLPTVCDTHDVISEGVARQHGCSLEAALASDEGIEALAEREAAALSRHDCLVTVTERDSSTVRSLLGVDKPTWVIAHTRSKKGLRFRCTPQPRSRVLFYGALGSPMNQVAAHVAATQILPLVRQCIPNAALVIAGSGATRAERRLHDLPRTLVRGEQRDLDDLLDLGDVLLLPLRTGSGLKGRVLEAMAAGLPVVGTRIAAEGIPVSPGKNMLIADDAKGLALHVSALFADPALYERVAQSARRLVDAQYTWSATYERIHECLETARSLHMG